MSGEGKAYYVVTAPRLILDYNITQSPGGEAENYDTDYSLKLHFFRHILHINSSLKFHICIPYCLKNLKIESERPESRTKSFSNWS